MQNPTTQAIARQRQEHPHPLLAPLLVAGGSISGTLKHTRRVCRATPKVPTKARFLQVPRLGTWAVRLLRRSPAGRASQGSTLSTGRACREPWPSCQALIARCREDAVPRREGQKMYTIQLASRHPDAGQTGAHRDLLHRWAPRLCWRPPGPTRDRHDVRARRGRPANQLCSHRIAVRAGHATWRGREQGGQSECDAPARLVRSPNQIGRATGWSMSVTHQQELTAQQTALTTQRRAVLPHPDGLARLGTE